MKGHVHQRGPDTWRVFYDLGADPVTGKRRLRSKTVHGTRGDAEKIRAVICGQVAEGTVPDPRMVTVREFADRWLSLVAGSVRPSTLDSYRQKLALACRWVGGRKLSKLTGEGLTELYRTIPRSAQTVVHVHRVVHRMLRDAVSWRLLASNPADTAIPPRVTRGSLRVWSGAEVEQFLAACSGHRAAALFRLAATTGMRRGELCALRWDQVDLERMTLNVAGSAVMVDGRPQLQEPKTRAGRRRIALDAQTVQALHAQMQLQTEDRQFWEGGYENGGWVFTWDDGRPLSPDWVSRQFASISTGAGLPHIRFHDLRHTWASLALEAGVPAKVVADRLGHAGIQITLDTYTHHSDELDRRAAEQVAGLWDPKPL